MNNIQHNQLDMFRAVSLHASTYQNITNSISAFANGINALNAKIASIEQTSGEQAQALTGAAKDKSAFRTTLIDMTYASITPVKAFALANNNQTLAAQMKYSPSDLKRIQDDQIGQIAQNLLNIVTPLLPQLSAYGITQATLNSWQGAINNYMPSIEKPRNAIAHRTTLTTDLSDLFTEANTILKNTLDATSITFKTSASDYYRDYKKAREIIDTGKGHTRIKGKCTHALTGSAIYNVKVRVNEQAIETNSDVDGLYEQHLKPATVTCTISADGFQTQTTPPFAVDRGATLTKDFALTPAP
ncbi:MAG: carboxypeptidase regulatory-like domain-containing protein [Bacteroidetes bacterium]|nr:carboxypeptidase regulatory-like domain-containing protein [Bacteroidota bacterium]